MAMLWIVSPVYNEEESLRAFVSEWLPVFHKATGGDFIFCLINDGSTDGSLMVMKELAEEHPELKIIDKTNTGHGDTCILGYNTAVESGADWVFQIDSDGQCDPLDFDAFWDARARGPVHYGKRTGREDGAARQVISKILSFFIFLLTFRWIRDANVPYRLMSRDALRAVVSELPPGFRQANVLLSLLQIENHAVEWHRIHFRRRPGRQLPVRFAFFLREAVTLFRDYHWWILRCLIKDPSKGLIRIARSLLFLVAAYYVVAFPVLALMRAGAFVEYDWLESVHMAQVHRILAGQPLYMPPSLEFTPILYGPLYPYLASVFAFVTGESYMLLRLISLAAAMGAQVMIWFLVSRMTGSKGAAWISAGLCAGTYGAVGFYTDTARVDSLALFFVMAMAYLVRLARERGARTAILAALAGVCAVLTKQTTLAPVLALSLWVFVAGGPRGRRTGVLCAALVLLSQIVPVLVSDGWFFYYLYQLPMGHPILAENVFAFLRKDLLPHFSIGVLLSLWAFFKLLKEKEGKRKALFLMLFLLAMTVSGLAPRFKIGGSDNNLIPFAATVALGSGLAMGLAGNKRGWTSAIVLILLLGFAGQLFYSPGKVLPSRKALRTTEMRVELFRHVEEPLFAPCDPYLPIPAGKEDSAFWGAILDTWLSPGKTGKLFRHDLRSAFKERRFRTIVLKKRFFMMDRFPFEELEANYKPVDYLDGAPPEWMEIYRVYAPRSDSDIKAVSAIPPERL